MTGEEMLHSAARLVADRRESYGDPADLMAAISTRWSITLGRPVTAGQVVLCLIDLKLARLRMTRCTWTRFATLRVTPPCCGRSCDEVAPQGLWRRASPPEQVKA